MNFPTAGDVTGPVRRRLRWQLDNRIGIAVLVCSLAAVIGFAAYLLARFDGIDPSQAETIERQAYRTTYDQARADAAALARESGSRTGARAGELAGARAGARLGERRGAAAVERRQEAIAERRAAAAAARRADRSEEAVPTAPEPVTTPPTEPAPVVTPPPAPAPEPPAPPPEPAPCFDAAGNPC